MEISPEFSPQTPPFFVYAHIACIINPGEEPPKKSENNSEKIRGFSPDLDNLDDLDKKTIKSVEPPGKDAYEGTCTGKCGEKRVLYWHVTDIEGKWGDFCQDWGVKVQETMQKEPYYNV